MDVARIRQAFSLKANLRSLWDRPAERFASIDGIRALSMLWVVITHLCLVLSRLIPYDAYVRMMDRSPWLFAWVLHGEKALDTFFVVSGLLIGMLLLSEHARKGHIRLRRFFARRYLRLMPAYAVALLVLLASGVEKEKAPYVWANILYVNNFLPQKHMFMDPSWSLAVEEQFYVILPLFLLGVFFRVQRRAFALVALLALSFAVGALVLALHPRVSQVQYGEHFIVGSPHFDSEYYDAMYVNLHTRFAPFVMGLGLAWAIVTRESWLRETVGRFRHGAEWLLGVGLFLLLAVVAVPAFDPHVTIAHEWLWLYIWSERQVWSLGVLFVMVAVILPAGLPSRLLSRFLAARIWYPVAQLSYCSYLFHLGCVLPGLGLALLLLRPGVPASDALLSLGTGDLLLSYFFTLFFAFLVGSFTYLLVERPFLNLRPR